MLNFQRLLRIVMGAVLGVLIAACTPSQPVSSKLIVSVPLTMKAAGKQSTSNLGFLIINVTGPNIPKPILYTWEARQGGPSFANGSAVIEVPTGSSRLVQVLAVYEDAATENMKFYYGDQTADLSKLDETVKVQMTDLNTASDIADGSIVGRYITSTVNGIDHGPTGEVRIMYQPPNDRPALIVERGSIASGWFNLIALRGVKLRYLLPDGSDMFGREIDVSDRTFFLPSERVAKIYLPPHARIQGSYVDVRLRPEISVIGYFGPAVPPNKRVCLDLTGSQSNYLTQNSTTGSETALTLTNIGTAEPTDSAGVATVIQVSGGSEPTGTALCPSYTSDSTSINANLYTNFLTLSAENFRDGRDGIGGFPYPFGGILPTANPVDINAVNFGLAGTQTLRFRLNTNVEVTGRLLPGLNSTVTSIQLYKYPASSGGALKNDDLDCFGAAANKFGATPAGSTGLASNAAFNAVSTLTSAEAGAGMHLGLCMVTTLGMRPKGVFLPNSWFAGGTTTNVPYLRVQLAGAFNGNTTTIVKNTCYDVKFGIFQGAGSPYTSHSGFSVALLESTIWYNISDSCGGAALSPGAGTFTFLSGMSTSTALFLMPVATSADNEFAPTSIPLTNGDYSYSPNTNLITIEDAILQIIGPSSMGSGICHVFKVKRRGVTNENVSSWSAGLTANIVDSGANPVYVYSSFSDCESGEATSTTVSMMSTQNEKNFYYKSTGAVTLKATAELYTDSEVYSKTPGTSSGNLTNFKINLYPLPSGIPSDWGVCRGGHITLVNENGYEVAAPYTLTAKVGLNSEDAAIDVFTDTSCTTSALQNLINFSRGDSRRAFSFRFTSILASQTGLELKITHPLVNGPTLNAGVPGMSLPATAPYVGLQIPNLKNKVLGSHEFVSGKMLIPFQKSTGSALLLECSPDGTTWTGCGGSDISGMNIRWSVSDAVALKKLRITATAPPQSPFTQIFDPAQHFGPLFKVHHCDSLVNVSTMNLVTSVNQVTVVNAVPSLPTVLAGQTLCVAAGTTITSATEIVLQSNARIIGSLTGTSRVQASTAAANVIKIAEDGAVLANLNLGWSISPSNTTTAHAAVSANSPSGGSGTNFRLADLVLDLSTATSSSFGAYGISFANLNLPVEASNLVAKLATAGTAQRNIAIKTFRTDNFNLDGLEVRSNVGRNTIFSISNSIDGPYIAQVFAKKVSVRGLVAGPGAASLMTSGLSGGIIGNRAKLRLEDSRLHLEDSTYSEPSISVPAYVYLEIRRSYLQSNLAGALISLAEPTSDLLSRENVLVQMRNFGAIHMMATTNVPKAIGLEGTHLVRPVSSFTGNTADAITTGPYTGGQLSLSTGSGDFSVMLGNGNRICSASESTRWANRSSVAFASTPVDLANVPFLSADVTPGAVLTNNGQFSCR